MRGELTAAMLHDPEIVLLDEPTIGLDVVAKERVREFLTEINSERGVTVLLTTHDLDDIERLCSRLLVIDHGRLIYDGDLDTLKQRYGGERVLVVDLEEPREPLVVDGARVVRVEGSRQWLALPPRRDERGAIDRGRHRCGPGPRPRAPRARHRGRRPEDLRGRRRLGLS